MKMLSSSGRGRARALAGVGLAVLLVGLACRAVSGQQKVAGPKTANYLTVNAQVGASELSLPDPFSEANKAGAALKEVRPGQALRLTLNGALEEGYHTYPLTKGTAKQVQDEQLSRLTFADSDVFQPLWPVDESAVQFVDEGEGVGVVAEHKKPFTWSQDVYVKPTAKPGPATLRFTLDLQVCDASRCIPDQLVFSVPLTVASGPAEKASPALTKKLQNKPTAPEVVQPPSEQVAKADGAGADGGSAKKGGSGLWAFVLQGIFWGAISLVTPCVFPMIPITVSFFLKQSEKESSRPLLTAGVYCATIVVVLTASAVALLSVFQEVSTHPVTNFFLGALFVFFALSLFGMYDIELPSGLANFTSQREGQGGLLGTVFMALTFTIISFACVAPFLGGFGGTAAGGGTALPWSYRILGGLAFSATFASPFFVLALFPALIKKLPKSGTWLNSVKVVMGFLELAAALKFFRAGELAWLSEPTYFTFDFVLGLYVAIALATALYLFNLYRLPHDTPIENLGVPRMLLGVTFLALGVYLLPGLIKSYDKKEDRWFSQRSTGVVFAWVESFLLPDAAQAELPWTRSLDKGLAEARQKGRLVLVDFTGVTCTNCSYNESNVFTKPAVKELLLKYTLVQLYTDKVPNKLYTEEELAGMGGGVTEQKAEAAANRKFQAEKFDDTQLPLYVILRPLPDGGFKEVARYAEGKINDPSAFVRFLRKPLGGAAEGGGK